ncbi:MAG: hypothetical protein HYZ50_18150 [Deltaproteobacteria bacterium]|nr:hypothetical protein [Deltaproteobacteria bacterium]
MTSTRDDLQAVSAPASRLRRSLVIAIVAGPVLALAYLSLQQHPQEKAAAPSVPTSGNHTLMLSETAQRNAGIAIDTVQTREHRTRLEAPAVVALDETRTARVGALVEGRVVSARAQRSQRFIVMFSTTPGPSTAAPKPI